MCIGCYEERGSPTIINDRVLAAAALIGKVYERALAGGSAHAVIDDWNLDDHCIQWGLDHQHDVNKGFEPRPEDELRVERECLEAMLALSEDERASALAINDGFFKVLGYAHWNFDGERSAGIPIIDNGKDMIIDLDLSKQSFGDTTR